MEISIIGGCGFIGLSLFNYLYKKNFNVKVIDTKRRFLRSKLNKKYFIPVNFKKKSDIKEAIKKTDILINLFSSTNLSSASNSLRTQNNLIDRKINKEIFAIANSLRIKKVIFSSSGGTVYGNKKKFPIKETFKVNPISNYGVTKLKCENDLINSNNEKFYILRISNVYGPLQFYNSNIGIISKLIESIVNKKKLVIWGDGNIIRDYIYIDDLTLLIEKIINENLDNGIYNISSGKGTTINEIIKKVSHITGTECKIEYVESREFDVLKNILCNKKIRKKINWSPKTSLESGIKKMYNQYINHH